MVDQPFITIFVPTYNRARTLGAALESCDQSVFRDFEVLVVDDGSVDDTKSLVHQLQGQVDYPLRYAYQDNQGKHVAHNHAVTLAKGLLFLTLDSDDKLLPEALGALHDAWYDIDETQRDQYCGINGLCYEFGKLTSSYPEKYVDADFLSIRRICQSFGEKRSALRVDILKRYPYPVFPGEKHCRPRLIENRMGRHYRTRFANIALIDVGHEDDGISANRRCITICNPRAYREYFLEEIRDHAEFNSRKSLFSYYKRYARHSFNCGIGVLQQYREAPNKFLWWLGLLEAWLGSMSDQRKLKQKKLRHS